MNKNDPAFPIIKSSQNGNLQIVNIYSTGGLTKREYFAAMALQGILAANPTISVMPKDNPVNLLAIPAVAFADALLDELSKSPNT